MKKLVVDKDFWDLFPDANLGVLVLKNVNEKKELNENDSIIIKNLLDESNNNAKKYLTSDIISENEVVKVWREAYSKFPTKKGARCSLENLLKRVLHDNPVGSICPSVDITNAISLKYAFPIGAEDINKLDGDLHLAKMNGNESFIPIGSESNEPPLEGEFAYADNYGVVCRCLNWRDGIRTQITDDTTEEFVVMECIDGRTDLLNKALDELGELFSKYLDAEIYAKNIVTINNSEIIIQ